MNRYTNLSKKLTPYKRGCFIPFVVLGDPSIKTSLKIIITLINNGADALELGIPFSDPLADGPIVQRAHLRAFNAKINLNKCFKIISEIRKHYPKIPIGILIYANLVFKFGIMEFYQKCFLVNIDSVLIADLPIEESYEFRKSALINNVANIFICPPDSNNHFLKKIAQYGTGYIYFLSRLGVTGIEEQINIASKRVIKTLKQLTTIPIVQGFGISNKQQIKKIILSGISGVICGSIIIKQIEQNLNSEDIILKKIKKISQSFKQATRL